MRETDQVIRITVSKAGPGVITKVARPVDSKIGETKIAIHLLSTIATVNPTGTDNLRTNRKGPRIMAGDNVRTRRARGETIPTAPHRARRNKPKVGGKKAITAMCNKLPDGVATVALLGQHLLQRGKGRKAPRPPHET